MLNDIYTPDVGLYVVDKCKYTCQRAHDVSVLNKCTLLLLGLFFTYIGRLRYLSNLRIIYLIFGFVKKTTVDGQIYRLMHWKNKCGGRPHMVSTPGWPPGCCCLPRVIAY